MAAERLTGVYSYSYTAKSPDLGDLKGSGTFVNLLWANNASGAQSIDPYAIPLFSLHGVVGSGITLGGGVGYVSSSGKYDVATDDGFGNVTTTSVKLPDLTAFVIAPRFGGVIPTPGKVSFWLKGGITYYSVSSTQDSPDPSRVYSVELHETGTVLSLDPVVVISPFPHTGILVGPVIDIPLGGEIATSFSGPDAPNPVSNTQVKLSNYGVAAGLALFL